MRELRADELDRHCGYPGHAGKSRCTTTRFYVRMPNGRHYWVCGDALVFVLQRDGEVLEARFIGKVEVAS